MMTKYVDHEKAKEMFNRYFHNLQGSEAQILVCDMKQAFLELPTADVVQVVRCKDCIHRDPEDKKCDCSFQAKGGIFQMDDDDFCSYGERRKEDVDA